MENDLLVDWAEDGQINEVAFCEDFLKRYPLKCINGKFFGLDGMISDGDVEKEIYRIVKSILTKSVSKKVKQLLEVLKLEALYWSSFLVTLCSEIMLYIETPLVSYSYSLNEVSHSCTS